MRDSTVTARDDHNPVINLRRYRRGDHIAPPEPAASRCKAYSRPITLHPIVIHETAVVLLPRTLQFLLLPHTLQVLVVLLPCTI
jgi:hypothetical protein